MSIPLEEPSRSVASNPKAAIEVLTRLGSEIHEQWQASHFREEAFPHLAYEGLSQLPLHQLMDPLDPIRWALTEAKWLPPQIDLGGEFGQPPLVVFATDRFFIQVLHWLESTTSIHQHSFGGAFQVVGGSSLHGQFSYERDEQVNQLFALGKLTHQSSELLVPGATRPILPNHHFIHSLFHLEQPSVTVVVRTLNDAGSEPQYDYYRPGLAIAEAFKTPHSVRKVQGVRLLAKLERPELSSMMEEILKTSDLMESFRLLRELLQVSGNLESLQPHLKQLRQRHGEQAAILGPAFTSLSRDSRLLMLRSQVKDPELRFFLALLLNFSDRNSIFKMVQTRYPGEAPLDKVTGWITRLCEDPDPAKNPFRISLDEASTLALRCTLEGLSDDAMIRKFEEDYDAESVAEQLPDLHETVQLFRSLPVLAPLFTE